MSTCFCDTPFQRSEWPFLVKAKLIQMLLKLMFTHFLTDSFEIAGSTPHVNKAGLDGT